MKKNPLKMASEITKIVSDAHNDNKKDKKSKLKKKIQKKSKPMSMDDSEE